jgi:hypothetical protein
MAAIPAAAAERASVVATSSATNPLPGTNTPPATAAATR